MFRRLLDRFNRFMYGRYGADSLYYTLLIVFLLLGFINTFLRSYILLVAADVLFIWALFRYFSKNIYQRREENRRFLDIIAKNELSLLFLSPIQPPPYINKLMTPAKIQNYFSSIFLIYCPV